MSSSSLFFNWQHRTNLIIKTSDVKEIEMVKAGERGRVRGRVYGCHGKEHFSFWMGHLFVMMAWSGWRALDSKAS
jgi:hypothetical protein